jgi:hypothetical protein
VKTIKDLCAVDTLYETLTQLASSMSLWDEAKNKEAEAEAFAVLEQLRKEVGEENLPLEMLAGCIIHFLQQVGTSEEHLKAFVTEHLVYPLTRCLIDIGTIQKPGGVN